MFDGWVQRCAAAIEAERARGAAPPGSPARDLAVALNSMNERVLYATFSGDGPAVAEDDVVDVLLEVWLRADLRHAPAAEPGLSARQRRHRVAGQAAEPQRAADLPDGG